MSRRSPDTLNGVSKTAVPGAPSGDRAAGRSWRPDQPGGTAGDAADGQSGTAGLTGTGPGAGSGRGSRPSLRLPEAATPGTGNVSITAGTLCRAPCLCALRGGPRRGPQWSGGDSGPQPAVSKALQGESASGSRRGRDCTPNNVRRVRTVSCCQGRSKTDPLEPIGN